MEATTHVYWYGQGNIRGNMQHRTRQEFDEFSSYVRERNVDEKRSDDDVVQSYNRATAAKVAWHNGISLLAANGEFHQRIGELEDIIINEILSFIQAE